MTSQPLMLQHQCPPGEMEKTFDFGLGSGVAKGEFRAFDAWLRKRRSEGGRRDEIRENTLKYEQRNPFSKHRENLTVHMTA
nr:hypothetical protein CFP56_21284 [Quercus suber]POF08254.1 hypothetical protein CFP56_78263 [Quercus suber]